MKTVEYLDLAKKCAGLPSDYALAHRIGVTPQAVSSWRSASRPRYPEVLHALMLADICRLDPVKVLADIEMDKATHYERTKELAAWHALLSRVSNATTEYATKATGTIVTGILVGALLTTPPPVNASSIYPAKQENADSSTLYIMSTRRRRERRKRGVMNAMARTLMGFSKHQAH